MSNGAAIPIPMATPKGNKWRRGFGATAEAAVNLATAAGRPGSTVGRADLCIGPCVGHTRHPLVRGGMNFSSPRLARDEPTLGNSVGVGKKNNRYV